MSNTKKKSLYIIRDEQKRWIFRVALAFAVNGVLLMWIFFGNFPQTSLPIGLIVICAYAIAGALFVRQWIKNGLDTDCLAQYSGGCGGWVTRHPIYLDDRRVDIFLPGQGDANL